MTKMSRLGQYFIGFVLAQSVTDQTSHIRLELVLCYILSVWPLYLVDELLGQQIGALSLTHTRVGSVLVFVLL